MRFLRLGSREEFAGYSIMEYDILGCSPNDSFDTIRTRYRALALRHHPDRKTGDRAIFDMVTEAFAYIQKHNVDAPTDFRTYRIDDDVRITNEHKTVEFTAFQDFSDGHAGWTSTGTVVPSTTSTTAPKTGQISLIEPRTSAARSWIVTSDYIEPGEKETFADIAEVHIDAPDPPGAFDRIPELTGPFEYKPFVQQE